MRSLISGGTTVLYVSHSIESIKSLCDKVVWLEHGKVIQVGTAEKVCAAYYGVDENRKMITHLCRKGD